MFRSTQGTAAPPRAVALYNNVKPSAKQESRDPVATIAIRIHIFIALPGQDG
jgi:hypothetical protein